MGCSIAPPSPELPICNCRLPPPTTHLSPGSSQQPPAICNLPAADANRWAFNMPRDNSSSYSYSCSYCRSSTTDDLLQLLRDNECQMQNTHTLCSTSPLVSIVVALRSRSHNYSHSHHNYKNNICVSCFSFFFFHAYFASSHKSCRGIKLRAAMC